MEASPEAQPLSRWYVRTVLAVCAVFVIAVLVFFFAPAVGSVDARTLSISVTRQAGGGGPLIDDGPDPCLHVRAEVWRCYVADTAGSGGGAFYRVAFHGRCYDAVKVDRETDGDPLPSRLAKCVQLRDQLDLWNG